MAQWIALALSMIAIGVSVGSVVYTRQEAAAAVASDRRARTPMLNISVSVQAPYPSERAMYRVLNEGLQNLDSVILSQPVAADCNTYLIAKWGQRAMVTMPSEIGPVEIGPLAMNQEAKFTLTCGGGEVIPELRVIVSCRSGSDSWDLPRLLPPPRPEQSLDIHESN